MRSTRFWTCSGKSLSSKGLDPYGGANLISVDIEISHSKPLLERFYSGVDPTVDAGGKPIARTVDSLNHLIKVRSRVADDVEDGAEDLFFKQVYGVNLKKVWGKEGSPVTPITEWREVVQFALGFYSFGMGSKPLYRGTVNDRANISGKQGGITDSEFLHRPREHFKNGICRIRLKE